MAKRTIQDRVDTYLKCARDFIEIARGMGEPKKTEYVSRAIDDLRSALDLLNEAASPYADKALRPGLNSNLPEGFPDV